MITGIRSWSQIKFISLPVSSLLAMINVFLPKIYESSTLSLRWGLASHGKTGTNQTFFLLSSFPLISFVFFYFVFSNLFVQCVLFSVFALFSVLVHFVCCFLLRMQWMSLFPLVNIKSWHRMCWEYCRWSEERRKEVQFNSCLLIVRLSISYSQIQRVKQCEVRGLFIISCFSQAKKEQSTSTHREG